MAGSRRLTPGRWLALKLASVIPIVYLLQRWIIHLRPGDVEFLMIVPMGLILLDGLVTRWTYTRQTART